MDYNESNSRDKTNNQSQEDTAGYRLVHLECLKKAFEKVHNCPDGELMLTENEGKRYRQSVVFGQVLKM